MNKKIISFLIFSCAATQAQQPNFEIYNKSNNPIIVWLVTAPEMQALNANYQNSRDKTVLTPLAKLKHFASVPPSKYWRLENINIKQILYVYILSIPKQAKNVDPRTLYVYSDTKIPRLALIKTFSNPSELASFPQLFIIGPGKNNNVYLTWDGGKKSSQYPLHPETGKYWDLSEKTETGLQKGENITIGQIKERDQQEVLFPKKDQIINNAIPIELIGRVYKLSRRAWMQK